MSRFKYGDTQGLGRNDQEPISGQVTKNGTTLSVLCSVQGHVETLKEASLDTLEKSREHIATAKAELDQPERYAAYAKHYYLTDGAFSIEQLARVKAMLLKIENGLNGDVCLKVGSILKQAEVDAGKSPPGGSVTFKSVVQDGARVARSLEKKYHNQIPFTPIGGEIGAARMGAIHIDTDVVMNSLGVQTLIHESSHKFAGTVDHCYFKHDKPWNQIQGNLNNSEQAFNNADSIGWLIYWLGGGRKWAYAPEPKDLIGLH